MRITRGKYQGRTAKLHQAANNWMTVDVALDESMTESTVVNPLSVVLTVDELKRLRAVAGGSFWVEYRSKPSGVDGFPFKLVRDR